ncbi:MAG: HDOD domain-containing protein [Bdellovibrionota bacterium]|jgi:putative nucleotidyltransferase with HDIG domain
MVLFGKFFSTKKNTPKVGTPELTREISSAILSVIGRYGIPTMASSAQRAFKLSVDPNASARDFIEVIESDEALSARVLKIANSVYFDRGKRSDNIEACVNVLGVNELRDLLSATTLSDLFPSKNPARLQFWINDIATGLAAKILGDRIGHPKKDSAFLSGLLHDIGKLLLLQRAEQVYCEINSAAINNERDFCGAEEEVFVFNHTEVGQLIAEKWNFSPDITSVIRNHHTPPEDLSAAAKNEITLPNLIWAADTVAHALGLGHPNNFIRFRNRAAKKLDAIFTYLGIPLAEKYDILQNIQRSFEVEKNLYLRPNL